MLSQFNTMAMTEEKEEKGGREEEEEDFNQIKHLIRYVLFALAWCRRGLAPGEGLGRKRLRVDTLSRALARTHLLFCDVHSDSWA